MKKLDKAMARLDAALARLETAVEEHGLEGDIWGEESASVPELQVERDELADQVRALRARAQEDAKLRAEAATAVRDALRDLRGAVGEGSPSHA